MSYNTYKASLLLWPCPSPLLALSQTHFLLIFRMYQASSQALWPLRLLSPYLEFSASWPLWEAYKAAFWLWCSIFLHPASVPLLFLTAFWRTNVSKIVPGSGEVFKTSALSEWQMERWVDTEDSGLLKSSLASFLFCFWLSHNSCWIMVKVLFPSNIWPEFYKWYETNLHRQQKASQGLSSRN